MIRFTKSNLSLPIIIGLILSFAANSYTEECIYGNSKGNNWDYENNWNGLTTEILTKLSSYDVQQDVKEFKRSFIHGSIKEFKLTNKNLVSFLYKIKFNESIPGSDYLIRPQLDTFELEKLNDLVHSTLDQDILINKCSDSDLIISGNFISLKNLKNIDLKCEQKDLENKQSLQIFALNTLFIDEDVNNYVLASLKKLLPISFLAPTWHVIGNRNISLAGNNGDKNEEVFEEFEKYKAKLEKFDALPGLPGEPGKFFFGVADKFIDGEKLTITSIGGNGANGIDGEDEYDTRWCKIHNEKSPDKWNTEKKTGTQAFTLKVENPKSMEGIGGRRGFKGAPGNITLVELHDDSKINKYYQFGQDGKKNSIGGLGGFASENSQPSGIWCVRHPNGSFEHVLFNDSAQSEAKKAIINRKRDEHEKLNEFFVPTPSLEIPTTRIFKNYLFYFRQNFRDSSKGIQNIEFYKEINKIVENSFSLQQLEDELVGLLKLSAESQGESDLLLFYESFLNNTQHFWDNCEKNKNCKEADYTLLQNLYAAALSRKHSLNENSDKNLIINVPNHIETVANEFKALADFSNSQEINKKILQIIETEQSKFSDFITTRTSLAKAVIAKDLQQEIDENQKDFKTAMEKLQKDVETKQDKTVEAGKKLEASRSAYLYSFILKTVGEVIDCSCKMASAAGGPEVAAVATVGNTVWQVGIKLANSGNEKKIKTAEGIKKDIATGVTTALSYLKSMQEEKAKKLTKMFETVEKVYKEDPEPNSELLKFVRSKKDKESDSYKLENFSYDQLKEMEKDFNGKVESEKEVLDKINEKDTKVSEVKKGTYEKVKTFIGKYEKYGKILADNAVNIYGLWDTYSEGVKGVDEALEKNAKILQAIKDFETNGYPLLLKRIEELKDSIEDLRTNIGEKDKINFDLIVLRTKNLFMDVKRTINSLILEEEYQKSKEGIFHVVDKMTNILPFLLNSNNAIQDFKEQGFLINYYTKISKAPFDIQDETNNKLKRLVIFYTLLKKYKSALKTVEQYTFPFAQKYLKDLTFPENMKFNDNISVTISEISTQINEIHKRFSEDENQVNYEQDDYVKPNVTFNSLQPVTKSFFVWENKKYKSEISRLLSGKEVILNADIMETTPIKFNAIKFKEIKLTLRINDHEKQQQLDKLLEHLEIKLTHFGNSHYAFNNKVYVINSNEANITHKSLAYQKLKDGSGLLSPYALWKAKLRYQDPTSTAGFSKVKEFENDVDILMEGTGSFVDLEYPSAGDYYKMFKSCVLPQSLVGKRESNRRKRYIQLTQFLTY